MNAQEARSVTEHAVSRLYAERRLRDEENVRKDAERQRMLEEQREKALAEALTAIHDKIHQAAFNGKYSTSVWLHSEKYDVGKLIGALEAEVYTVKAYTVAFTNQLAIHISW